MDGAALTDRDDLSTTDASDYQSLSPLAALAFALGVLSPAALVTPLLLIVPVTAIGVALLAFAKIRASGGALTGTRLAQWGMALAVGFTVTAIVRDPVRNALMHRQTQAVAEQWLTLVAGGQFADSLKLLDAQAVQSLAPRPHDEEPGQKRPSAEEVLATALESLERDKLAVRLAKLGPPLRITADEQSQSVPVFDGARTLMISRQVVAGSRAGDAVKVDLNFVRAPYYEAEGRPWRIERWAVVSELPTNSAAVPAPNAG